MRKLLFIFGLILVSLSLSLSAQTEGKQNVWEPLLNDVKIRYAFRIDLGAYLPKPKFGKELKELDGKEITVKGFFLPLDVTGNIFVISYHPMNMCYFCTGSGYQTIIEMNVIDEHLRKFNRLRTDNYIEVKGILQLNDDDYEHLVYILNDAELVKIHK